MVLLSINTEGTVINVVAAVYEGYWSEERGFSVSCVQHVIWESLVIHQVHILSPEGATESLIDWRGNRSSVC